MIRVDLKHIVSSRLAAGSYQLLVINYGVNTTVLIILYGGCVCFSDRQCCTITVKSCINVYSTFPDGKYR